MSPCRVSPKVSVVIPTYNCDRFLPEAIGSVLRQTMTQHEVILKGWDTQFEVQQWRRSNEWRELVQWVMGEGLRAASQKLLRVLADTADLPASRTAFINWV